MYGATRFIRVCHLRSNKRLTNRLHRQRGTDAAAFDKIGERSRTERAVKEFRKSLGEALIKKQLITAQVKSDGLNLRTVLNRGARGLGKRSRRHGAAARAAPLLGPVFSHFKSNRRQIKNLPALTRITIQGSRPGRAFTEDLATRGAQGVSIDAMVNDPVGHLRLTKRFATMSSLAARFFT